MNNVVLPERIVCACNKYIDNSEGGENLPPIYVCSVRHFDPNSSEVASYYHNDKLDVTVEQGFMTNKHRYVDRCEAMKIAIEQNQVVRLVGSQAWNNLEKEELYSENLY